MVLARGLAAPAEDPDAAVLFLDDQRRHFLRLLPRVDAAAQYGLEIVWPGGSTGVLLGTWDNTN